MAGFGSGKIPRLDLIKLVDVILNSYFWKTAVWPPILGEGRGQDYQFSQFSKIFQYRQSKGPLQAYLDIVIRARHLWMVLNVENVFKLQADHETFLQSDRIEAFGALRVRAGEVRAGDHASPLGEEVVTALHCGKYTRAK